MLIFLFAASEVAIRAFSVRNRGRDREDGSYSGGGGGGAGGDGGASLELTSLVVVASGFVLGIVGAVLIAGQVTVAAIPFGRTALS